jgi:SulP family sulfate permease
MIVAAVTLAVLFMKRMSEITETKLMVDNTKDEKQNGLALPEKTSFYEVNGPLFFGAAQRAMEALHASENDAFRTLIIHLGKVPVIDATGFAALENAVAALVRRKKIVILAGPLPQPRSIFERAKLDTTHPGMVHVVASLDAAVQLANEVDPPPPSRRVEAAAAE